MHDPDFTEWERALMDESKRIFAEERSRSSAFTDKVMATVAEEPEKPRGFRRWALVAAAVAIALLWFLPRDQQPGSLETARWQAEKIGVTTDRIAHPDWFAEHENLNLVAMVHAYGSDRCLWLFPEASILEWESEASEKELEERPRWRVPVNDGRLSVPEEAFAAAGFESATELVMMSLPGHYEIWKREALDRYLKPTD